MTQEEKLEEAKRLYETANQDQRYVLESLFPELKESEDERIRKELINFIENWRNHNPNSPFDDYPIYTSDERECNKILAWLEKQGERKSQRMISAMAKEAMYDKPAWSEEDASRTSSLTDVVKSGGSIRPELRNEFVDWLNSLKERYTWKPSDEQIQCIINKFRE